MGTANSKTSKLYENAKQAVTQMGLEEEVVLEHDPKEIGKYGILDSPAIVIDGNVMAEGKELSVDEIIKILEKA